MCGGSAVRGRAYREDQGAHFAHPGATQVLAPLAAFWLLTLTRTPRPIGALFLSLAAAVTAWGLDLPDGARVRGLLAPVRTAPRAVLANTSYRYIDS